METLRFVEFCMKNKALKMGITGDISYYPLIIRVIGTHVHTATGEKLASVLH